MKRLLPEMICLITVSILCLLLPNQNNYLNGSWITHITGISSTILLSIKIFLMEPLFWGILCFFLLRCEGIWLMHHEIQPQIGGKLCIVMRIAAIVLTTVLLYWTWGGCHANSITSYAASTWLLHHESSYCFMHQLVCCCNYWIPFTFKKEIGICGTFLPLFTRVFPCCSAWLPAAGKFCKRNPKGAVALSNSCTAPFL